MELITVRKYDLLEPLKIEHLANTRFETNNDSSNLSDIFARCGRTISPLLETPSQQGLSWQE